MDEEYMCACTIAGSDSGGGAGIQADLKTFTAIGVWGVTVVTAITAQNTREVVGSWTLPPETVYAQLDAVAVDYPIRAVKTGMLGNADVVDVVARRMIEGVPLVVDPIIVSTSGYVLLEEDAIEALVKKLIPRASVVTPNLAEAAALTGVDAVRDIEAMRKAAKAIRALGAKAVVVKGGHLSGTEAADILIDGDGELMLAEQMLPYEVHGSGCCFSAALTAYLAAGLSIRESAVAAKHFVTNALHASVAGRSGRRAVQPTAMPASIRGSSD